MNTLFQTWPHKLFLSISVLLSAVMMVSSVQAEQLLASSPSGHSNEFDVWWVNLSSQDMTAYSHLVFEARGEGNVLVRMIDSGTNPGSQGALVPQLFPLTDHDQTIAIPISRFAELGEDMTDIAQISFHYGPQVWNMSTGNTGNAYVQIANVRLDNVVDEPTVDLPTCLDDVVVRVNHQQWGDYYFEPAEVNNNQKTGDIINASSKQAAGQYTYYLFDEPSVKGQAVLHVSIDNDTQDHVFFVDDTKTRFTYFTSMNKNQISSLNIDPTQADWITLAQFMKHPETATVKTHLPRAKYGDLVRILNQFPSLPSGRMGFVKRSSYIGGQADLDTLVVGAITQPSSQKITLSTDCPGIADYSVITTNPAPLPATPATITTDGRQLLVDGEPYVMHGATLSAAHPNDLWRSVEFTLDYVGGHAAIRLMAESGINTIRTYFPPEQDLMDALAQHGIRVIVTISYFDARSVPSSQQYDIDSGRYLTWVSRFANHPALLAIELGNEFNLEFSNNPQWIRDEFGQGVPAWYRQLRQSATAIRALSVYQQRPVPISTAQSPELNGVDEIVVLVNDGVLDMVGFNVFRGGTLNNISTGIPLPIEFAQKTQHNPVPMYLSEWGDNMTVHQTRQFETAHTMWNRQLVPAVREGLLIGGAFMTWQDEDWKAEGANPSTAPEANLGMVKRTPQLRLTPKPVYYLLQNVWTPTHAGLQPFQVAPTTVESPAIVRRMAVPSAPLNDPAELVTPAVGFVDVTDDVIRLTWDEGASTVEYSLYVVVYNKQGRRVAYQREQHLIGRSFDVVLPSEDVSRMRVVLRTHFADGTKESKRYRFKLIQ